jgi:hypothetical protein
MARILAIGRAHEHVDVIAGQRIVVEHDAGLVVEFDQDRGAQDAVIEQAAIAKRADPSKMRIAEVTFGLGPSASPVGNRTGAAYPGRLAQFGKRNKCVFLRDLGVRGSATTSSTPLPAVVSSVSE